MVFFLQALLPIWGKYWLTSMWDSPWVLRRILSESLCLQTICPTKISFQLHLSIHAFTHVSINNIKDKAMLIFPCDFDFNLISAEFQQNKSGPKSSRSCFQEYKIYDIICGFAFILYMNNQLQFSWLLDFANRMSKHFRINDIYHVGILIDQEMSSV